MKATCEHCEEEFVIPEDQMPDGSIWSSREDMQRQLGLKDFSEDAGAGWLLRFPELCKNCLNAWKSLKRETLKNLALSFSPVLVDLQKDSAAYLEIVNEHNGKRPWTPLPEMHFVAHDGRTFR